MQDPDELTGKDWNQLSVVPSKCWSPPEGFMAWPLLVFRHTERFHSLQTPVVKAR